MEKISIWGISQLYSLAHITNDQKQDDIREGQSHLGDLGTDWRKILKKQEVTVWIRHSSFRTRSSGRLL
jgi:hypothetical protein